MKKLYSLKKYIAVMLCMSLAMALCACGKDSKQTPRPEAQAPKTESRQVASVEVYNLTGNIQREEFYPAEGSGDAAYTVQYSYTDSGRLSEVTRKTGGDGLTQSRPVETRFYSGDNCTRRIVYDEMGATSVVYYWTYDAKGKMLTQKTVSMLLAENGYSYSGKSEEVIEYAPDGSEQARTFTAPGVWEKNKYTYGTTGRLLTDERYSSLDGEVYFLAGTKTYTYNDLGLLTGQWITDDAGKVTFAEAIEYNDAGKVLSDTAYPSAEFVKDNISWQKLYEYGEDGKLNMAAEFAGDEVTQLYYRYYEDGSISGTSEIRYVAGEQTERTDTENTYDERGNCVKTTVSVNGGKKQTTLECAYEYYSDGRIKSKTNYRTDADKEK